MDNNHPTYKKIDNTFDRVMNEINKFDKVFQPGGKLEQAIMEIDGDPSYLKDVAQALSNLYEALEEAHFGTTGHVVDDRGAKESVQENKKTIKEGVLDGGDEDGFMARSQLYFLARDAIKLHGIVKDQDDLAPWVSSKIAQASKDMDSVRRYTEYNAMKAEIEPEAHAHEMPQEMNEGTMIGGLMKYDGQPEGEYADAVARYKEFMSQPRPPSEATTDMVQGFIFDDELLDSLSEAEDGGDVLDVRYIVQSRLEDFFGPDFELGESVVYEAKQDMCPEACCGKPITECKCGPDCEHCDCHSKNSAMNEGMDFDEKRNDDLKVVAKDMFKNALANAKKKVK